MAVAAPTAESTSASLPTDRFVTGAAWAGAAYSVTAAKTSSANRMRMGVGLLAGAEELCPVVAVGASGGAPDTDGFVVAVEDVGLVAG